MGALLVPKPKKRPAGFIFPANTSVVPSSEYVLLTVGYFPTIQGFTHKGDALLFLDQIKPIEQLVPVS